MAWFKRKNENDASAIIKREVANALEHMQLQGNAMTDVDGIRQRIAQAVSGGYDHGDTLHNIYLDYGYPQTLTFYQFWNMYRRFGIAHNVVDLPVDIGWMTPPMITGNDKFNDQFEELEKHLKLFTRLQALDKRQRVGRYAGLYVRVRDGQKPDVPLTQRINGIGNIISVIPIYEGQLKVSMTDNNPMSDNFGLPTMYEFNSSSTGNRNEQNATAFSIHPSRLIIAAEGADNGGIYGVPSLEAPYNSLMDLRKIIGGGGEGFYKNAAQNIVFELSDASSAKSNAALLNKFNEGYDDFSANRFRRGMWTPGMKPHTLQSDLANPKEFFASALNDVAAASQIPATILIGAQTGRLASSEDSKHFLSGVNSRRENFMSSMVRDVIDWFMLNGALDAADYDVEWDDLLALSQQAKLENASSMSEINERAFKSGQDVPFTSEEVRETGGFDPEELPDDEGEVIDAIEPE